MMSMIGGVVALAGVPVALAALYLVCLTAVWRRPRPLPSSRTRRVCVLVPAYNEALGIGRTIRSLQATSYPPALRRIVVIADNCTDDTARIARARGAEVIERHDADRRGKGWALSDAIAQLLAEDRAAWDTLVVVDADTLVGPDLLDVLTATLDTGARAAQAAYRPRPGADTPTAVITDVAFAAFHLVRSGARERLGLSCGLRGNGMAFAREVLQAVPHTALSRTEDLEFGVMLGWHGVRVAFAGQTTVYGDMPEQAAVVTRQRERWIGGRLALARRYAAPLLREAVRRRQIVLADLAVDLLIPPVSALVVLTAAGLAASLLLAPWSSGALLVWTPAAIALGIHVAHAAAIADRLPAFLRALGAVPAYALGKARLTWRGLGPTDDVWVRTAREGEQS